MEFLTHLASGAWIVSSWVLRMPRFGVGRTRYNMVLDGYLEVGGSASVVREVATPAAAAPRSIVGSVFDSITHRALSGARVHLADLGARGRRRRPRRARSVSTA